MVILAPPRSVSDATRFTSTTPYAIRRADMASSAASASRFQAPPPPAATPSPAPGGAPAPAGETPAQKVARLRAAHLAAKNAQVSRLDRLVDSSRRLFDSAHRITIVGLIGFTAIAGLLTAYTAVDMMRFNAKRKAEFIEAQRQMEADSLDAARLAYMRGDATPEQTAMVEEALEASKASGADGAAATSFFKVPSLLGTPTPVADAAAAAAATTSTEAATTATPSDSKVLSALERERANQRNGGPLDRLGLEPTTETAGKKSWWKVW